MSTMPSRIDDDTGDTERASAERAVLELRDLSVRYRVHGRKLIAKDTVHALTEANLSVRRHETVGIVGESGCGKSTLARAVVGLQRPTSGDVIFNGTSLWEMSSTQRRTVFGREVAMVFQDPSTALNRRMPVHRILRDSLDIHRVGSPRERDARVRELMDLVGLPSSAADALPAHLSGGQRQRVAIGRALSLKPSLLVADEPTSALDVSVRAQVLNLLSELKQELGLAMVFISHDIATVRRMSDRIATMYLGRIVEQLRPAQTPDRIRHPYTKALLSATPSLVHERQPISLDGPLPSPVHPPSGCPFHPRCWRASDVCVTNLPEEEIVDGDSEHPLRCHHPLEIST